MGSLPNPVAFGVIPALQLTKGLFLLIRVVLALIFVTAVIIIYRYWEKEQYTVYD